MEEGSSFIPILLGIMFDPKKRNILIIKRDNNSFVKELTWVFPGGKAVYNEELEKTLKKKIKEQTGFNVEILGNVFTRIPPEKKEFLLIYYLCEVTDIEGKTAGKITELKWVGPEELEKYFTTSLHPNLKEYVLNLK